MYTYIYTYMHRNIRIGRCAGVLPHVTILRGVGRRRGARPYAIGQLSWSETLTNLDGTSFHHTTACTCVLCCHIVVHTYGSPVKFRNSLDSYLVSIQRAWGTAVCHKGLGLGMGPCRWPQALAWWVHKTLLDERGIVSLCPTWHSYDYPSGNTLITLGHEINTPDNNHTHL